MTEERDPSPSPNLRVGFGLDVHRLAPGLPLTIGGVRVPHPAGWVAHSDGDALLHALCDALLGAAALGDIGHQFPDNDPQYAGIDSRLLLRRTRQLIAGEGWRVANVDCTIALQQPKIAPFIEQMRDAIAADLDITPDRVGLKATTTERLGYEGRQEGGTAYAVALLYK